MGKEFCRNARRSQSRTRRHQAASRDRYMLPRVSTSSPSSLTEIQNRNTESTTDYAHCLLKPPRPIPLLPPKSALPLQTLRGLSTLPARKNGLALHLSLKPPHKFRNVPPLSTQRLSMIPMMHQSPPTCHPSHSAPPLVLHHRRMVRYLDCSTLFLLHQIARRPQNRTFSSQSQAMHRRLHPSARNQRMSNALG